MASVNDIYNFKVKCDKVLPRNNILTVVWIHDNYNRYKHIINVPINFTNPTKIQFSNPENKVRREYYLIHDGIDYINQKQITWLQAAELCKSTVDGYLPWFGSRESLHEFLSFLKLTPYLPTIYNIYIGLKIDTKEVSKFKFRIKKSHVANI